MRADGTAPAAPLPVAPTLAPAPARAAAAPPAAVSDGGAEAGDLLASGTPRDVPYNYSFFHGIFALASCYTAMLLTEWGLTSREAGAKDSFGVGWVSAWVKIACTWATSAL
jgi:hypothetical protein